jgi:hypothetical protein
MKGDKGGVKYERSRARSRLRIMGTEFRKMQPSYFCGYTEGNPNTSQEHRVSDRPLGILVAVKSSLISDLSSHSLPN